MSTDREWLCFVEVDRAANLSIPVETDSLGIIRLPKKYLPGAIARESCKSIVLMFVMG